MQFINVFVSSFVMSYNSRVGVFADQPHLESLANVEHF